MTLVIQGVLEKTLQILRDSTLNSKKKRFLFGKALFQRIYSIENTGCVVII